MKRKNSYIHKVLDDLNDTMRYLNEDYIFNEGDEDQMMDDMEMSQGIQQQGNHMQQQDDGDNAEQKAMHVHEIIQHEPIIQKIRQTAIDGLRKYAEDPTSSIYEFFKKVFLESDKVLTDDGSSNK
jgi:hypothetical protein